jgi:hypothetical protein
MSRSTSRAPGRDRPAERLAEVAGAGAHRGVPVALGQQAGDQLGAAAGDEAADRVRGLQLDADRAAEEATRIEGSGEISSESVAIN